MLRPVALAAALVLLAVLAPGTAQATETYPGLDLDAALAALEREPIHRVPAAQARFDEAQVRPLLDPDTRGLVIPYAPLDLSTSDRYDSSTPPSATGPPSATSRSRWSSAPPSGSSGACPSGRPASTSSGRTSPTSTSPRCCGPR